MAVERISSRCCNGAYIEYSHSPHPSGPFNPDRVHCYLFADVRILVVTSAGSFTVLHTYCRTGAGARGAKGVIEPGSERK